MITAYGPVHSTYGIKQTDVNKPTLYYCTPIKSKHCKENHASNITRINVKGNMQHKHIKGNIDLYF